MLSERTIPMGAVVDPGDITRIGRQSKGDVLPVTVVCTKWPHKDGVEQLVGAVERCIIILLNVNRL